MILFIGLVRTSVMAQVNLSLSLTACYDLNANANEPINNLTGTLSAVTPTVDRFSNANSAYSFAGTSGSHIRLPNSPLIKSNAITFSCWVRFNVMSAQIIAFAHNGCPSYHEGYQISSTNIGPGGYRFQIAKSNSSCNSAGQVILNGNFAPVAQTWYHLAFYAGPDSLKLFVNGNPDAFMVNTNPLAYSSTANVYLGGTNLGVNLPFSGSLDNVRFYNRKLNNAEINQLYSVDPTCTGGPVPVASFSVSTLNICANQTITLNDLSTNTPTAWAWQMAGATPSVSSITNPVTSFPNPGNYTISLITTNGFGASNPVSQTITVKPLPIVTSSAVNTLICSGSTEALVANGASTYTWSTSQIFQAISVSPTVTTTYSVVGTGTNGCKSSSSITINVSPCTSIAKNNADEHFEIYPNPSSGKFMIAALNEINEVLIFDLLGEIIFKADLKVNETKYIDISNKPNGIYFVKLNAAGSSETRKIIKE